mgnify:CR=1 FL=1
MKNLVQIHTDIFRGSYTNSRSLIFLAEGYREEDESLFYADVASILDKLENTFPFSCLKGNGNNRLFSIFVSFSPSSQFGYATSPQEAVNRTTFETYFQNGNLYANSDKINSSIEDLIYMSDANSEPSYVKNSVSKGVTNIVEGVPVFSQNKLIFVLLPESERTDIELEVVDSNTYYTIFTSVDSHAEQVILKEVGRILGLGDEFDKPGEEYLKPTEIQGDYIRANIPNLYYAPEISTGPNPSIEEQFIWRYLFDRNYNSLVPIHKKNTPEEVNRTLPAANVSYKNIELWEGGGGFRTDVYRSAEDCLLRRRIGDSSLPVKSTKISLCPICEFYLRNNISR